MASFSALARVGSRAEAFVCIASLFEYKGHHPDPFSEGRSFERRWRHWAAFGARVFRGRGESFEGRGGRIRRGGIKFLVLGTLLERPRHGYDIMEQFERHRGFRPSPGSIYRVLSMLEDGGYIAGSEADGKRVSPSPTPAERSTRSKRPDPMKMTSRARAQTSRWQPSA